MSKRWVVIEARVDWITATGKTGEHGTRLLDLGAKLLTEQRTRGNYGRPTTFEGYHGTQSQSCFVGYRLDGSCIRLGGELAGSSWRDVYEQCSNVSRLDLAITVTSEPAYVDLARDYWLSTARLAKREGRQLEYTLIQARGGGDTLYCGRRASERFGRIYNKHAESKGHYPAGSWRFEIEYKRRVAGEIAKQLAGAADYTKSIIGVVSNRFQDWGVTTPWDPVNYEFRDTAPRQLTDNDTRMRWLESSVRASIEKLSASYTSEQLRLALGLSTSTFPQPSVNIKLTGDEPAPNREVEIRVPHPDYKDVFLVSDG